MARVPAYLVPFDEDSPRSRRDPLDLHPLDDADACPFAGRDQGRDGTSVVDPMLAGQVKGRPLALSRLRPAKARNHGLEPRAVDRMSFLAGAGGGFDQRVDPLLVRFAGRESKHAGVVVVDAPPGLFFDLAAEASPEVARLPAGVEERP